MTKLQNAYNEFIADFCERHGECQATRDEAHEIADKLVAFGASLGAAASAADIRSRDVESMIEAVDWDYLNSEWLVSVAVWGAFHA